ncbi:MAG: alpha-hydroxy acid oxidase [SAR324 cluster bacterium]|nr:alpha-hydroxy acid oxidase [SAR324 cluster bacterium]
MKPEEAINIEDLHQAARRRMPKVAFDYFEGGAEDERGLARNEQAFRHHRLLPRYLVDVSQIDQRATLFGRTYSSPFGISPTGIGGLLRPGADLMLAEAAAAADIPYTLSSLSTTRLEDVARVAPQHAWYQLYGARERRISEDQIRRANDAGMHALMFTVDVPVFSKRERELRNRFGQPRLPLRLYLEALRHPAWLFDYFRHGMPVFENWAPYSENGSSAKSVLQSVAEQFPVADHTWRDVENFRRIWSRPFILKGILHPDDAVRAAELGVDGILVSNHGARQLDAAPSPLEMLPAIKAAVGDRVSILVDSGFRRGSDIVIALALGAKFVFLGRAALYGVAAFGLPGAKHAIAIMQQEIEITLKQIGCPSLELLGPHFLLDGGR